MLAASDDHSPLTRALALAAWLTLLVTLFAGSSEPALSAAEAGPCHGTLPNRTVPLEPGVGPDVFNYGNARLRTHLYWPRGTLVAEPPTGAGVMATISSDGSISLKLGWWRGVPGKLVIKGRRLDAYAPPLHAHVPEGYGARGFQPTGLVFPTVGCWKVTGSVGNARLSFVVKVLKSAAADRAQQPQRKR